MSTSWFGNFTNRRVCLCAVELSSKDAHRRILVPQVAVNLRQGRHLDGLPVRDFIQVWRVDKQHGNQGCYSIIERHNGRGLDPSAQMERGLRTSHWRHVLPITFSPHTARDGYRHKKPSVDVKLQPCLGVHGSTMTSTATWCSRSGVPLRRRQSSGTVLECLDVCGR